MQLLLRQELTGVTLAAVEQQLLSPAQVARLLDVSTTTIYRLVKTGELKVLRIGRNIKIELSAVDRYLDSQRVDDGE